MSKITQKWKKLIAVFMIIILIGVLCPTKVSASWFDFSGNVSRLFFWPERGLIKVLNDFFCDESHEYKWEVNEDEEDSDPVVQVFLSAEAIISGKFIIFDANIFDDLSDVSDKYDGGLSWPNSEENDLKESKSSLRETIAGWYYNLFNFAMVAMLSVLVYVGIRMAISTISQDKAKYKIMLKDWIIAICVLVMMHYIMVGILNITSLITEAIGGNDGTTTNQIEDIMVKIYNINEKGEGDDHAYPSEDDPQYTIGDAFAYELLLLCIIIITALFVYKYLKREFIIIFLILLGPISCITYPIDKISDGKAQAFNKWFSEFLYNVLIQPFHLLLYTVLVSSAVELANHNIIYAICCLAVLIPAEKFVKEMFGFRDKLGSPLGAMATGAMASQVIRKAFSSGDKSGGKSGAGNGGGNNQSTEHQLPPKTKDDSLLVEGMAGNNVENTEPSSSQDSSSESEKELNEENNGNTRRKLNDGEQGQQENLPDNNSADNNLPDNNSADNNLPDNNSTDSDSEDNSTSQNEEKSRRSEIWDKVKNSKPVGYVANTPGFVLNKGRQALSIHNQRASKRWDSTNRKQRWINKTGKLLKTGVRATGTLAGAAALGTFGLMAGQGAKGAIAGAALGSSLTNKAINTVGDYYHGMSSPETQEHKALNNFKASNSEIDNAVLSYRKNNAGRNPSNIQLDQEMDDRFELSRYGLNASQIDDVLPQYQQTQQEMLEKEALDAGMTEANIEKLKEKSKWGGSFDSAKYRKSLEDKIYENRVNHNISNGKNKKDKEQEYKQRMEKTKQIAASRAKYTSKLSEAYSAKDFRDDKVMKQAQEKIMKGLKQSAQINDAQAEKYARDYIKKAAKIKGVSESEVALPQSTISLSK